jgi:hypothetical protein
LNEGILPATIVETGNTVIDAPIDRWKIETEHYQHPEIERLKRLIPTIKKWF